MKQEHRAIAPGRRGKGLRGTDLLAEDAFNKLLPEIEAVPLSEESFGRKACAPRDPSRSCQLRAQAFTLLVHAYSEVRSAMAFIL